MWSCGPDNSLDTHLLRCGSPEMRKCNTELAIIWHQYIPCSLGTKYSVGFLKIGSPQSFAYLHFPQISAWTSHFINCLMSTVISYLTDQVCSFPAFLKITRKIIAKQSWTGETARKGVLLSLLTLLTKRNITVFPILTGVRSVTPNSWAGTRQTCHTE